MSEVSMDKMAAGLGYHRRPSLEERVASAREKQASYIPSDEVAHQLGGVTLGSLIGVSGVGKSHLIPFVVRRGGANFSEVGNISSRAKRNSDPNDFRGSQPIDELLGRIERREVVNYLAHPSGDIYATDTQSYHTDYVLLPTLSSVLEHLQTMGCFKRIVPIGLTVDGTTWGARLEKGRGTVARMQEALICVAWLRKHSRHIPILESVTGKEEVNSQVIVGTMVGHIPLQPQDNLDVVDTSLAELTSVATRELQRLQNV